MLTTIAQFGTPVPGYTVAPTPAPRQTFPTEGSTDIFSKLDTSHGFRQDGPVYPSLSSRLFPALEALDETVKVLGKNPGSQDVDRSNVRRIIRSVLPLALAHQDSYPEKKFKKAVKGLKQFSSAVGRFKDFYILEGEIKKLHPSGLPKDLSKALDKEYEKREKKFKKAYREFRKEELPRAIEVLSSPRGLDHLGDPREIVERDRRHMAHHIGQLADKVDQVGLGADDPDEFHEGRKALRGLLIAGQATRETFDFPAGCLEGASQIVNNLGVAQDSYLALEWCQKSGFKIEAAALDKVYSGLHDAEVEACRNYRGVDLFRKAVG